MSARIAICAAQIPFVRGGAEVLYESLRDELVRRGHQAEIVSLPFNWSTRLNIVQSALAWRLVDLTSAAGAPIDLVIATRFPSYLVRHPRKVVWLIGPEGEKWDAMFVAEYPNSGAFMEMVTDPDYRIAVVNRQAAVLTSRLIRFSPQEGDSDSFG